MTVNSLASRAQYTGNGVTTVFTGPALLNVSHIEVYLDGALLGSGLYTVAGVGGASTSVTMLTAPLTGEILTLNRNVPLTQTADYVANDPFPAESHEGALDKLTMIEQQQQDELGRALKFPVTDAIALSGELPSAATRADKVLGFDAIGAPSVSTVSVTLLVDAQAAADAAEGFRDEAETFRDEAQASVGGVKVSADDTTAGNLEAKVVAGTHVAMATLNPAANEQLEVSLSAQAVNSVNLFMYHNYS